MYVQNNMRVLLTMIKILFYFIIREPFITSLSFQVSFDRFLTRDYKTQIIWKFNIRYNLKHSYK